MEKDEHDLLDDEIEEEVIPQKKAVGKSEFDISFVVFLLLAVCGFLIGRLGLEHVMKLDGEGTINSYLFVILTFGLAMLFVMCLYELGRYIFGRLTGYKFVRLDFFGISFVRESKKIVRHFFLGELFSVKLMMAPKNPDLKAKPRLMLMGGVIFFNVVGVISVLLLGLIAGFNSIVFWSSIYAVIFGELFVIYELLPFKIDFYNDGYVLRLISSKKDTLAYNLYLYNIGAGYEGKELILPTFEDYQTSLKMRTLIYLAYNEMNQGHFTKTLEICEQIIAKPKLQMDEDLVKAYNLKIDVLILQDHITEADEFYLLLMGKYKKFIKSTKSLEYAKTKLAIVGLLENKMEDSVIIVHNLPKYSSNFDRMKTLDIELHYFDSVYKMVKIKHPDWDFEKKIEESSEEE